MAESVDALVSNTSGGTSIPVRPRVWVRKEQEEIPAFFVCWGRAAYGFLQEGTKKETDAPSFIRLFLFLLMVSHLVQMAVSCCLAINL